MLRRERKNQGGFTLVISTLYFTPVIATMHLPNNANQQDNSDSGTAVRDSSMDGKASFALGVVYTLANEGDPRERVHLLTGSEYL